MIRHERFRVNSKTLMIKLTCARKNSRRGPRFDPDAALGVAGGEEVPWELLSRNELHLVRKSPPPPVKAKKCA